MQRFVLYCFFFILSVFSCFGSEKEEDPQDQLVSHEVGHLSLYVGAIGIAMVCLFVLLQYFLSRWTCPIREKENRKIFILNRTNIGHKICAYLIEVEEELFLIIQSPNQVICKPVRGAAKWDSLLPFKEIEESSPKGDSLIE